MEAVKNAGGHVAFASERHPFELPLLERLRSRIGEALITEITPFEAEERRAFVECVARRQRVALPGWAIDRIANCGVASVRVLLGCVRAAAGLEHSQQLDARRLDASMTAVAGADAAADLGEKDLLGRIANYFSVATADVESRKRGKQLSEARNVAAALLHGRGYSLPRVGAVLGGRDKSTAHDMVKAGKAVIEERQDLRDLLAG
jgi:chromosomal replication initiation ATPase DnaA